MKITSVNYADNNLLRVVPFQLQALEGAYNLVIDDGSTLSFIDKSLRDTIPNLKTRTIKCKVSGLNGQSQEIQNEEVVVPLLNQSGEVILVEAVVVDEINPNITLPNYEALLHKFPELKDIKFPNLPDKKVQILCGQNAPEVLVAKQADLFLGKGHPNVRFTAFGPALGFAEDTTSKYNIMMIHNNSTVENSSTEESKEIARLIQQLINNEETPSLIPNKRMQSPKNEELELQIRNSFSRTPDGHIQIPIPWKSGKFSLQCNYQACLKFDYVQKQKIIAKNPDYWTHCIKEIENQVQYGAAGKLTHLDDLNEGFYHPIVVVLRPTHKSTPVRMCLDASRSFVQKDASKKCFNDQLPTGTNLLNDIRDVLTLFRTKPITLVCDLTKMFFNVYVPESERKYLRFIFNGQAYESYGYPFGLRVSPYIATLCLKIRAEKSYHAGEISLETFEAVDRQLYMDDGIFSLETEQQAIELSQELMKTFDSIHMCFNKFISCSKIVMKSLPENRRLTEVSFNDPLPEAGTLGLNYDAEADCFSLNPVKELAQIITKSEVMRLAAKIYDPNNYLALITIKVRKLTQLIFQIPKPDNKEISFSENLENYRGVCPELIDQIVREYYEFGKELMVIDQFKIPRLLVEPKEIISKQLIVFSDGSTTAYGAVAYLRALYHDGTISVRLIKAAKKCTPIRRQTIPRIELMAALEGAKLAAGLKKLLKPECTILFSDAIVVLFWILKSDLHRFSDWIQVRLTQIHELTKGDSWRHVESGLNPADFLSRGLKISHILDQQALTAKGEMWFEGPPFLKEDFKNWPRNEREVDQLMSSEDKELVQSSFKTFRVLLETVDKKVPDSPTSCSFVPSLLMYMYRQGERVMDSLRVNQVHWTLNQEEAVKRAIKTTPLTDYSQFQTIKKAAKAILTASIIAINWFKKVKEDSREQAILSLSDAYKKIIREIQSSGFRKELEASKDTQMWPLKSVLSDVNALFDQDNILRSNSRLSNCVGLPDSQRRPILLPHLHPFVQTIIHSFHINIGHGGSCAELLSAIRKLFYFPKMRQITKKYLHNCVTCRRKHGRPMQPHMATLPTKFDKVSLFEQISLDFFGPVSIIRARSTEKYYVLVIICSQTHALHLEMCESAKTKQVLTALQRFCAEKRMPKKIRSDRGTSFIAAKKALATKISMEDVNWDQIQSTLDIPEWEFTTAASPETNAAEAYVRLVKTRLDLDLSSRRFTRDQLSTLLVLACTSVNNRPLTYLSDNVNDPLPITANMLMYPAFQNDLGLRMNQNSPIRYRRYYEEIWEFAEATGRRWVEEFSKELKKFPKWKKWSPNAKVGDIVVVIEANPLKTRDWPLGIITKVFPDSKDNVVRKCHVKYKTSSSDDSRLGIYLRHVRNLIPLGIWHEINEDAFSQ